MRIYRINTSGSRYRRQGPKEPIKVWDYVDGPRVVLVRWGLRTMHVPISRPLASRCSVLTAGSSCSEERAIWDEHGKRSQPRIMVWDVEHDREGWRRFGPPAHDEFNNRLSPDGRHIATLDGRGCAGVGPETRPGGLRPPRACQAWSSTSSSARTASGSRPSGKTTPFVSGTSVRSRSDSPHRWPDSELRVARFSTPTTDRRSGDAEIKTIQIQLAITLDETEASRSESRVPPVRRRRSGPRRTAAAGP